MLAKMSNGDAVGERRCVTESRSAAARIRGVPSCPGFWGCGSVALCRIRVRSQRRCRDVWAILQDWRHSSDCRHAAAERYNPDMRSHPRLCWAAMWLGLALCSVLIAGWSVSVPKGYSYVFASRSHIRLSNGGLAYFAAPGRASTGWHVSQTDRSLGLFWPILRRINGNTFINVPLWLPFAISAVGTTCLWRFGKRIPPGYCRCGYDLTGNVSGVCPECGKPCSAIS